MTPIIMTQDEFQALSEAGQRVYLQRFLGKADKDNEEILGTAECRLAYFQELLATLRGRK